VIASLVKEKRVVLKLKIAKIVPDERRPEQSMSPSSWGSKGSALRQEGLIPHGYG